MAPNQRGYSAGARPAEVAAYGTENLVGDALEMMHALGYDRAHIVGHDWGGQLSWLLAAHHPERVTSLSLLSRPHPQAYLRAPRVVHHTGDLNLRPFAAEVGVNDFGGILQYFWCQCGSVDGGQNPLNTRMWVGAMTGVNAHPLRVAEHTGSGCAEYGFR